MKRRFFLLSLLSSFCLLSQAQMAIGTWKTHFSYNNVKEITESAEKIYAISNGSLFSVDKAYESIETYSKINGLNDGEIAHIAYSKENDLLFIAYSNSNIDLLKGNNAINISDLKRKEISDKEINHIYFYRHYAYLSCGFGIVVIDTRKSEVADTYIIGERGGYLKVNSVQIVGDYIYALTANGIHQADIRSRDLSNFENWTLLLNPAPSANRAIASFNNELVLLKENSIYRFDGSEWAVFREGTQLSSLNVSGGNITFFNENYFVRFDKNWEEKEVREQAGIKDLIFFPSENNYWIAQYIREDDQTILIKYKNGTIENSFIPNGPYSSKAASIKYRYGKLLTISGGPYLLSGLNFPGIVQIYENGKWTVIRKKNLPAEIGSFVDILDAEVDPVNHNLIYVASFMWDNALFLFDNDKFVTRFTPENINGDVPSMHMMDGLLFDTNNNLWILNMNSPDLLVVKKADGTWTSLYYPDMTNKLTVNKQYISKNGYRWVTIFRAIEGLFVIDDKGTPFTSSDDRSQYFHEFQETGSAEIITPIRYYCITEDKNNAIWIGTNMGPLIVSNPNTIFNSNFTIDRIKITREDNENLADYLLGTEEINDILVDGGNRKWIATGTSGLYLLSPNGQETIHHFTTENSPLTSNTILSLAMDEETGELFIATSNALYSFKSDSTEGAESYSGVHAYPNPVRPGYAGLISVSGLMEKSVVKIADVQGNLIHEGISNGGTFTWDGKNLHGKRVGTGVYLVLASLSDGSEKVVTKIAFIN
ncbi:MAG: hypothetical protein LBR52_02890 [Prevotellaceae bacterium]|jgi:hypothetical protein|nr:hypothetical protein [Prevotellaceae bacterium]